MTAWITQNLGWKLISLALAILIWINVASEPEMATLISVPVQYRQPPNGLEVSSRLIQSVQLEAKGSSGQLRDLVSSRVAVILDFSGVTEPGERTFNVSSAETNFPRGVELLRATPAQLHIRFEKTQRRSVPVRVRFSGEMPQGLHLLQTEPDPKTEEIVGPESLVRRVEGVSTDPIDLHSLRAGTNRIASTVYSPEPEVRFAGSSRVTVNMVVK